MLTNFQDYMDATSVGESILGLGCPKIFNEVAIHLGESLVDLLDRLDEAAGQSFDEEICTDEIKG